MNFRSSNNIYLDFFWKTKDAEKQVFFDQADQAFNAMVKGGMSEADAKDLIEKMWSGGYTQGYDSATYDHQEVI